VLAGDCLDVSAAVPLDEDTGEANPEQALAMFVAQTQGLDRDALLARVAEAASKEADAVTKLGQLTCVPRPGEGPRVPQPLAPTARPLMLAPPPFLTASSWLPKKS